MRMKTMLLASGALMCFGGPAFAQSVATTDSEDIVVTGKYTIDEQIDTATGLGLTIRETPQSVTVITSQRIIDQSLDSVADVAANTPGVNVQQVDDVRNTLNARGFEINNYQYDGVPVPTTLAGSQGETMVDSSIYERIEVVRGATGLLTGAGDPSASINLVRKHANKTQLGGYLNVSYGSWDNYKAEADVGGALNADGSIRARVVGKYKQGDSNVDFYENEKIVLYGVVEADIGENTLVRVGASHQEGNPKGSTWGALPAFFSDNGPTNWSRSKSPAADWTFWDTENQNAFVTLQHEFGNGWEVVANYNWTRNAETTQILYLSGTVDRATGELSNPAFPYSDDGDSVQNSFDIQVKGKYGLFGREHEFTFGAIHSKQKLETTSYSALAFPAVTDFYNWNGIPNPGFSPVGVLGADIETEQTGYFAATRLNVTDKLKLIAGARLASYEQTGITFGTVLNAKEDNQFIPYAGALYDLTDNHRVYASYTEIFLPQNARDFTGATLDPIVGKSYEVGLKSAFFNEALQTSLAVFRIEQDNLAQLDPLGRLIPGVTPPTVASIAAEGATSEGVEFEIVGEPVQGWNVSLGIAAFKAEDATGLKVNSDFPRETIKLFTTYEFEGGTLNGLTVGGGVNWSSKAYSPALLGTIEQDSFALVSLMSRYKFTDQLSVQANIENVTDEKYFSQVGFFDQYRYGSPRNFEISLNYAF